MLSVLHTEAFIRSMRKQEEFDAVKSIMQMFDCISEEDQKRFCKGMLQKKGFFEDASAKESFIHFDRSAQHI